MNPMIPQMMISYPYGIPQARPVTLPHPIQFPYPQMQPQIFYPINPTQIPSAQNPNPSFINPMVVNKIQPQPQIPLEQVAKTQANTITDNSTTKTESTSQNPMKLLTKYKDIYVPTIFLLDYSDTTKAPFNLFIQNQPQQIQGNIPVQMMNNIQINQYFNKYFNYGYNFEQWKKYVAEIKGKFDELNELVKSKKIILPEPDNELEYLMAFPSDYGGLGDIQKDQNYENVKFYDPKDTSKNPENKDFMSMIRFEHETWFPLEPNPSSLNKNINNDYFIFKNPSVNPLNIQKNFLIPNQPATPIVPKLDNNIIGNNGNAKETENKVR